MERPRDLEALLGDTDVDGARQAARLERKRCPCKLHQRREREIAHVEVHANAERLAHHVALRRRSSAGTQCCIDLQRDRFMGACDGSDVRGNHADIELLGALDVGDVDGAPRDADTLRADRPGGLIRSCRSRVGTRRGGESKAGFGAPNPGFGFSETQRSEHDPVLVEIQIEPGKREAASPYRIHTARAERYVLTTQTARRGTPHVAARPMLVVFPPDIEASAQISHGRTGRQAEDARYIEVLGGDPKTKPMGIGRCPHAPNERNTAAIEPSTRPEHCLRAIGLQRSHGFQLARPEHGSHVRTGLEGHDHPRRRGPVYLQSRQTLFLGGCR